MSSDPKPVSPITPFAVILIASTLALALPAAQARGLARVTGDRATDPAPAAGTGDLTIGTAFPPSERVLRAGPFGPVVETQAELRGAFSAWLAVNGIRPSQPPEGEAGPGWPEAAPSDTTPGGLVGNNFPIANFADAVSSAESLDRSSVAYNPRRDEYLVAWQASTRAAKTNVYGRFVSASGTPLGAVFAIAETTGIDMAPSVAYDSAGDQYFVAWTDLGTGSTANVRLRRLSPTGAAVGGVVTVNGAGPLAFAARVACGANRCIVAWNSDPGDGNAHILARSYDTGANAVTAVLLLSDAVGVATEPDIAFNSSDSNFLVVWYESHAGTGWDVMSHGITPDIASYGKKTVTASNWDQKTPRVAYSPVAGRFLIVWYDSRSGQTWDVYGQFAGRDCAPIGNAFSIYSGAYHDAFPAVAGSNTTSQFLVAYQRDISGATQFQIFASSVSGTGAVGASFQVRGWYNTRIWPAIAHRTGSSDYLVSFTEDGFVTQPDIQAQIARADGTLPVSLTVVARGRKGQETPRLAHALSKGEYLVAWGDFRSGGDYDLYARRVSSSGALLGQEIVAGSDASLYGYPAVAYGTLAEEYLVVWQEVHGPSTGYDIYARRVGVAGDVRGAAILVSRDTNTYNEGAPRVINNPSGEYLVVWHAFTNGQWRIWGQRLSSVGVLIGSNFLISASSGVTQTPHVAMSVNRSEYLVVWQDMRNGGRVDIYGQRLTPSGSLVGGNIAISTATGDKDGCDVAYGNTSTGYLVVFGDQRSGKPDVYGQYLDGTGALVGAAFPIANGSMAETAPVVIFDIVQRKYVAAWWQYGEANDWDVWARAIPVTGGPTDAAYPVSAVGEVQNWPELAVDTVSGKQLVVWQDFRANSYDVYGQLVDPSTASTCTLTCSAGAPATGSVGAAVAFTGSATPSNCSGSVSYDWNFGDGTAHATSQNPSHTYASAGTFNWQMTASVAGVTCTKSGSITIGSGCALACTATAPTTAATGSPVSFTATATPSNCTGSVTYDWNFGDGTAHATTQNPSHAYSMAGTYTWQLTASAAGVTCTKSGSITVGGGQGQSAWWVPVVSHAAGAGGSNWRSDVGFMNRSSSGPATVTLRVHATSGVLTGTRSVPANGQEVVVDVAAQLGLTNGSAALEVLSNQPLFVTSRTYNQQSSGWTYGQSNDGVASGECLGAGESAWLPHLVQNGSAGQTGTYRSNVGLTNIGATAANVTLTLYDANGVQLWSNTRSIGAGEWYQYQEPFRTGAGRNDIPKGYAKVTVNSGSGVVAYGSVLDNASSDATTITMKR